MKEKLIENKLEFLNLLIILMHMMILFIGSIQAVYGIITLKKLSITLLLIAPVELILYIIYKIKNKNITKSEIIIYILFILSGLSLFGTTDLNTSIWGFTNRYEGLLMIYSYYIVFLITSTIKNKTYKDFITYFILLIGFTNFIYGLFQMDILGTNIIEIKQKWDYARGFQGNSMYYSSLIIMCYFIPLGKFLYNSKINIITVIIFTLAAIISGSMGLCVSTIIVFIFTIIKHIVKKEKNIIIKLIICLLIFLSVGGLFFIKERKYSKDIKELSKEISSTVKNKKVEESYGTGRIHIWENVIKKSKENLLFGVGIDNLYNSFNKKLIDKKSNLPVDKAHNEYLQKIVCEGIISGITYILFLAIIFKQNYKENNYLFMPFLAYTIQAFFNISVIRVAPFFWIITGLLNKE
ncbi:MAG: O-antigen ligase family protein [Bacilli bacterium]|nr:O-antigen ligase family protein [Bacilli bacterium]